MLLIGGGTCLVTGGGYGGGIKKYNRKGRVRT